MNNTHGWHTCSGPSAKETNTHNFQPTHDKQTKKALQPSLSKQTLCILTHTSNSKITKHTDTQWPLSQTRLKHETHTLALQPNKPHATHKTAQQLKQLAQRNIVALQPNKTDATMQYDNTWHTCSGPSAKETRCNEHATFKQHMTNKQRRPFGQANKP